jgi:thiamine biosynthesis lipoprotein
MPRHLCPFLCAALLAIAQAGCGQQPSQVQYTVEVMGTVAHLTVYAADRAEGARWLEAGQAALHDVDDLMSTYKPDSELSRLNAAEHGVWHHVSSELMDVLKLSKRLSRESGGCFDVTVRPLIQLWRKAAKDQRLPTDAEIAAARAAVGWDAVELDEADSSVNLNKPGMSLDLGAVAKGYAVDRAVAAMKKAGATGGLVEAGGDLYAFGTKPGGAKWIAGIRNPRIPAASEPSETGPLLMTRLAIADLAVVTSGHYERYTTIEGKRYSHIFDPRTGRPVDQRLASVTVTAPNAALADGLATAVAVMGPEQGMAMIERLEGVEALLYVNEGDDKPLRAIRSSGLAALEKAAE